MRKIDMNSEDVREFTANRFRVRVLASFESRRFIWKMCFAVESRFIYCEACFNFKLCLHGCEYVNKHSCTIRLCLLVESSTRK